MNRFYAIVSLAAALISVSCSRIVPESATVCVSVGLDEPLSRAVQPYPEQAYRGKWYLFASEGTGYVWVEEGEIVAEPIHLEDLSVERTYKLVLVAVPVGQVSALPGENGVTETDYEQVMAVYQSGPERVDNDIFRDILSFRPSAGTMNREAVLTRQNGAVEVRLQHIVFDRAELYVAGTQYMYLNDGGTGQVLSTGAVNLSVQRAGTGAVDERIRIHLLPQEDITGSASGNRLILYGGDYPETGRVFPLQSDQGVIPVYPNQVTWLTLGSSGGSFTVSFSNIQLDDDDWDGWQPYSSIDYVKK